MRSPKPGFIEHSVTISRTSRLAGHRKAFRARFAPSALFSLALLWVPISALAWNPATLLVAPGTAPRADSESANAFLAVWENGSNIMYSRSTNAGQAWTSVATLNDDAIDGAHHTPHLANDKAGNWVNVYAVDKSAASEVRAVRSDDHGVTWKAHVTLGQGTAPDIATDHAGHWVAVFQSSGLIVSCSSANNGATWSNPVTVGTAGNDKAIATDGVGNWVVIWSIGGTLLAAHSADNGATWTGPQGVGPGSK